MDRYLHPEDMETIRQWFPNIRDFVFDLDPSGCLLTLHLFATDISRHPKLEHLGIHLPHNIPIKSLSEETIYDTTERIFKHIDSQKPHLMTDAFRPPGQQLLRFNSLDVGIGNWDKLDGAVFALLGSKGTCTVVEGYKMGGWRCCYGICLPRVAIPPSFDV
ncbi:hypothetical protein AJ80_00199 [Polytolypa hystricis UAMH7299]|uniref:Uncharacterized protein n=1 Tax=Polytolypa hystricis (strain UAMH7299) TaxID=1447883 RepID=A0A2B7Z2W0_POLH7|nr:hypothetical protein AJ80_00199 [Polytolypa hystricis UAMH7299]